MTKSTCTSKSEQLETNAPSQRDAGLTMRILKSLDWLSRCASCLAVMLLITWMAWSVLQDRSHLSSSLQAKSQLTLASGSEGVNDVLDGQWQFADVPWSIKIERLPEDQARSQLNRPSPTATELGQTESSGLTDVFDILSSLNATVIEQQGIVQYRVEKSDFSLIGFAPQTNRNAVGCLRLAQGSSDGTWNYLEFSSQAATAAAGKHLLPMLGVGTVLASKRDSSKQLLAELVSTELSLTEMRSKWEKDGWAIEEADAKALVVQGVAEIQQELSTNAQPKNVLICSKDSNAVAVVTQNADEYETLSLLLIRLVQK